MSEREREREEAKGLSIFACVFWFVIRDCCEEKAAGAGKEGEFEE